MMFAKSCIPALLVLALAGLADVALADGCFVKDRYGKDVVAPDQKVAIAWDGHTETMILSTELQSDELANFGWIIPIQSTTRPEVDLADVQVFHDLRDHFKLRDQLLRDTVADYSDPDTVFVVGTRELGAYDITVLKASDPDDLQEWLSANGSMMPPGATDVFSHYTHDAFYFVVVRLDLLNARRDDIRRLETYGLWDAVKGAAMAVPTTPNVFASLWLFDVYNWASAEKLLPMLLAKYVALLAMRDAPYPGSLVPYFPREEYDRLEKGKGDIPVLDVEAVQDSALRLVQKIMELRLGMARPIKISFAPGEPVFPLRVSRINQSNVLVTAYVFTPELMTDGSGILQMDRCMEVTAGLRRKIGKHLDIAGCQYLSRLTFEGPSSLFAKDARFVVMDDKDAIAGTDRVGNLYVAIREGDLAYVKDHVADLGDINSRHRGCTALHFAVIEGQRDIVEFLLNRGAAVDASSGIPSKPWLTVSAALDGGNPNILELIVNEKTGVDISFRFPGGETLLHEAAQWCSAETVTWLLAQGADRDARDGSGRTALDRARSSGNAETVRTLEGVVTDPGERKPHMLRRWRWRLLK